MLVRLLDLWNRRSARAEPAALAAIAGLAPATVVTGASQGIGFAIAERFAAAGHDVVLVARAAEPLEDAARRIRERSGRVALALPLDITTENALAAIEHALATHGLYLDVLVNNAGTGLSGPFASHTAGAVENLVALNVAALTRLMHAALPGMRARARGGVLNVASLGGLAPGPNQAVYYASKAYVISLTEAVASELGGQGVRVSALAPGPVETAFHAKMNANRSLYRWLIPPLTAEQAAGAGVRGYMLWRRLVVPGVIAKGLAGALRLLPHFITVPLVGWLLAPAQRDRSNANP